MQPFDLSPNNPPPKLIEPEPEKLQGWSTRSKLDLGAPHPVPALIELDVIRSGATTGHIFSIRGPAVTVGRYTPATGPVDIDLSVLQEHERIRIGLPHLRLGRDLDGWWIEPMTMYYPTYLNGCNLTTAGARLDDGALLVIGDVQFRVNFSRTADRGPVLARPQGPCLRLKREGAATGITIPLNSPNITVGRAAPAVGRVDVDLSSLPDPERVHLARRHARFWLEAGAWHVEPLVRGPIFVNRNAALDAPCDLATGDEIALGNVMFTFVDVLRVSANSRAARAANSPLR